MHNEAFQFVAQFASLEPLSIVEIGSRNINGTVRSLFPNARYTGLDLVDGLGVDVVCDAIDWTPPELVDLVICCEVLEHSPRWPEILSAAGQWLHANGRIIVTCAGPGREPHSAADGGPLREGEYYRNLTADEVAESLHYAGFEWIDAAEHGTDTQAFAKREHGHTA